MLAIVTRKSTKDERQVSVGRQEKLGREWASQRHPDVPVVVFSDNAISGQKMDRPGWLSFVDHVQRGGITLVWAYEQSRLTRAGTATWEEVCKMLVKAGIKELHTFRQGTISVEEGARAHGRIIAVFDLEESERARLRVLDAMHDLAQKGLPSGATGFGFRRVLDSEGRHNLEPDPVTAPIAVKMIEDVAAGHSLGAIASALNASGVRPSRGATWAPASVRAIVMAPRNVALRVHRGQVVGPAAWSPLVDRSTWEKALARLSSNRPGVSLDRRRPYLLSGGLVACAACGAALISASTPAKGGLSVPAYQCPHPSRRKPGCGKCSIVAERLESHVVDTIAAELDDDVLERLNDRLRAESVDTRPIHAELEHVEGKFADLAERHARDEVIEIEYAVERRVLNERRSSLLSQLAHAPVDELTVEQVLAAWDAGGIARRDIIPLLVDTPILVAGAFRDGRRLSVAERVTLTFR